MAKPSSSGTEEIAGDVHSEKFRMPTKPSDEKLQRQSTGLSIPMGDLAPRR